LSIAIQSAIASVITP